MFFHGFGKKSLKFYIFFLAEKGEQNVFDDIVGKKNVLVDCKNVEKLGFFQRG